ncbi:hypothetical protein AGRA3207_002871 [Actinomadura graeca]|uniref:Swt1-like HEPN domain-containing protein n=1 Tax=Actinomadura graeca TaxID=2750812 RepID=A0ABX8QVD7_9ACTN|nr:Swt1 family HEPN domain-containing protein [Actinomadura graeca]QXJ21954.1 hypothetical protein AGRA3207_002871 [Actinomadura graeca]
MTTKLVNQDQVTAGLRTVTQVLNPFVQKRMTGAHGKNWLPDFVRRHPRPGASQEHLGDLGFLIWVLTKDERAFGPKVLPRQAKNLAHRIREARNLASHEQLNDLDLTTARTALQSMAEFLTLIGEPGKANEVRQLTGRLQSTGSAAPHAVRPKGSTPTTRRSGQRSGSKTKTKTKSKPQARKVDPQPWPAPPPRKTSARPVIQLKIGCGAVVALAVIALATVWVLFGQRDADPYEGKYKNEPLGARLNTGRIEIPRDYHLRFLDEPIAPLQGAFGGDLGFSAGQFTAADGRIVVVTRGEKLSYATCRDTTRYAASTRVTKTLRMCVTTDTGVVAGVAVRGVRKQGTNTFVKIDIIVWKGRKPKG